MSGLGTKAGQRVIGSELDRHDAIEKVQGRTSYAADHALPRMLHAMLKRSDYAHARLGRVDVSAGEAIIFPTTCQAGNASGLRSLARSSRPRAWCSPTS